MIACHCNAVTDTTILSAIACGAADIDAIGAACEAGRRCGGCHDTLDNLLDAALAVEEAFEGAHPEPVGVLVHLRADGPRLREAAR